MFDPNAATHVMPITTHSDFPSDGSHPVHADVARKLPPRGQVIAGNNSNQAAF